MKVGQKVRIKKEMQLGDCVGQYVFMEELDKLKGAILEIVKVDDTDNSIEVTAGEIKIDRGYGWLDRDMVELTGLLNISIANKIIKHTQGENN